MTNGGWYVYTPSPRAVFCVMWCDERGRPVLTNHPSGARSGWPTRRAAERVARKWPGTVVATMDEIRAMRAMDRAREAVG